MDHAAHVEMPFVYDEGKAARALAAALREKPSFAFGV